VPDTVVPSKVPGYVYLVLDEEDTRAVRCQDFAVERAAHDRIVPRAKAVADKSGAGVTIRDALGKELWFVAPEHGIKQWVRA
jgi:hypothetical protein